MSASRISLDEENVSRHGDEEKEAVFQPLYAGKVPVGRTLEHGEPHVAVSLPPELKVETDQL